MRIETVECFAVELPIREPYQMAGGTHEACRSAIVRVTTSDGVTGVGEAHQGVGGYTPETPEVMMTALETFYAQAVVGENLWDVEAIWEKLNQIRIGHTFAKAAVDLALHDALGKATGQPVSRLLGGAQRKQVRLVGNVGMYAPEVAAERAVKRVEEGYTTIKIKVAGPDLSKEIARVRAVREAVGPSIALRVDANGAYRTIDALRLAEGLAPYSLEFLEQPVAAENMIGLERVMKCTSVPIMIDEGMGSPEDAFHLFSRGLADVVKIKINKAGGFRPSEKIIAVAGASGGSVVVGHGMGTSIQGLAEVHLIASSPVVLEAGDMVGSLRLLEDLVEQPMVVKRGAIDVPEGPGLGVQVIDERLNRYAFRRAVFRDKDKKVFPSA